MQVLSQLGRNASTKMKKDDDIIPKMFVWRKKMKIVAKTEKLLGMIQ